MTRKMAWIAKLDLVETHPNADSLDICTVGGWKCVTKRDEFKTGDLAVYVTVDAWVPHAIAPFLSKGNEPREYEGVKGERLRTVRLRNALSQGLLMSIESVFTGADRRMYWSQLGKDVSEILGIIKWEAQLPACLAGDAVGLFPSWIPQTNQERIQNLKEELEEWRKLDITWEVTEKCEGTSHTAFYNNEEFGICSRNLQLKENADNSLWSTAATYDLKNKLTALGRNIAIQSELIGPGIQKNIYTLTKHELRVFDIYDIDQARYLTPDERDSIVDQLGLTSAPVLKKSWTIDSANIGDLLFTAEGKSIIGTAGCEREGLVFKANTKERLSFKAISNKYLIKQPD